MKPVVPNRRNSVGGFRGAGYVNCPPPVKTPGGKMVILPPDLVCHVVNLADPKSVLHHESAGP